MSLYGYKLIHETLKELRDGTGKFLSGLNVEGDQATLELALEELEEMIPKIKLVLETVEEYDRLLVGHAAAGRDQDQGEGGDDSTD